MKMEVLLFIVASLAFAYGGYVAPAPYYDASYYAPKPYDFGYDVKDVFGNQQFRKETSNGKGAVFGSYGYTDAHGIYRVVEYIADEFGYRAKIKTNEPGTANQNPAHVNIHSQALPYAPAAQLYHKGAGYY